MMHEQKKPSSFLLPALLCIDTACDTAGTAMYSAVPVQYRANRVLQQACKFAELVSLIIY